MSTQIALARPVTNGYDILVDSSGLENSKRDQSRLLEKRIICTHPLAKQASTAHRCPFAHAKPPHLALGGLLGGGGKIPSLALLKEDWRDRSVVVAAGPASPLASPSCFESRLTPGS